VVRLPSLIFLKFYSNCHCPIWWTSVKFEWNLSRNGMIIKLFSWGCLAGGAQIVHIWPCLNPYYCQTTLVYNTNFSGMLVTSPNNEKMMLSTLWLSKVTDTQSWLFLAPATNFRKFSNLTTVVFLDIFLSHLEELLVIKLSLTLEFFFAKYYKVCEISWAKLGTKWKNFKSGVSLSPRLPMTTVKICIEKIFTYSFDMASLPYKVHEWFSMFS